MPDWKTLIRENLPLPPMKRWREEKIFEELAGQLEDLYRDARRRGLDDAGATRHALEHIGDWDRFASDITGAETRHRRTRGAEMIEQTEVMIRSRGRLGALWADFLHDVRYALRSLRRRPGFLIIVTLILALGIGANTAIYSVLNTVLFRPFPYPEPEQLMTVWTPQIGYEFNPLSAPDYLDYRESCEAFTDWGAYTNGIVNLSGGDFPERWSSVSCTAGLLRALGIQPASGRLFGDEEAEDPASRVVILCDRLWKGRFGADPGIVGTDIIIDRQDWTVIGIMPEHFRFPGWRSLNEPGLLLPLSIAGTASTRGSYYLNVIGRLRPEVTPERTAADLQGIATRLEELYPESNHDRIARLVPLRPFILADSGRRLWILMGAVGLVLLIACTNVAGLLLARGVGRGTEIAIRSSLGASRQRLVRQMLTESGLLALLGGICGVGLAWLGIAVFRNIIPGGLPRIGELRLDGPVLLFSLLLALSTGLLAGLLPALSNSTVEPGRTLQRTRLPIGGGRRRLRILAGLVTIQFALALILTNGAGLMFQSLRLVSGETEISDPEQVLIAGYTVSQTDENRIIRRDPFLDELLERLRALPDVSQVGVSTQLPLYGGWTAEVLMAGEEYDPEINRGMTYMICASPGFIEAVGIPLLQGRSLQSHDMTQGNLGVLINRSLAESSWPGENPIGKQVRSNDAEPWFEATVVGVVEDVRMSGLESEPDRQLYLPFFPVFMENRWIALRTHGNPADVVPALRAEMADLDPHLPLSQVFTAADLFEGAASGRRFRTHLIALFALLALVLITAGTYGTMTFHVARHRHEVGVQIALGADRGRVLFEVIRRSLRLAAVGIVIGTVGAVATARITASLLFGVEPLNILLLAGVGLFLALVAGAAALIPALRAVRIDPVEAMRLE